MTDVEQKTLINISIDNLNQIFSSIELEAVDQQEPLRIIHSLLVELSQEVLDKIIELKMELDDEE